MQDLDRSTHSLTMNSLMSRYDPNISCNAAQTSTSNQIYKPYISSYTVKEERTPKSSHSTTGKKNRNTSAYKSHQPQ